MTTIAITRLTQLFLGLLLVVSQLNAGCPQGMDCAKSEMTCCQSTADGSQNLLACMTMCQVMPGAASVLTVPGDVGRSVNTVAFAVQVHSWSDPPGLRPPRDVMI